MAGGFSTIDKSRHNTTKIPNPPAIIIEILSPGMVSKQLEYRVPERESHHLLEQGPGAFPDTFDSSLARTKGINARANSCGYHVARRPMNLQSQPYSRWLLGLVAVIGLAARLWTLAHLEPGSICGNDFPPLYAGGKLAGTPDLYSPAVNQRVMQTAAGCTSQAGLCFMRPPFVAALMWPFARLPLRDAMLAWGIVSLLALAGFLWLWPAPKLAAIALVCWSLPVGAAFTQSQDSLILLLWIALAATLLTHGRDFAAGLILALCAAKFHLFFLLPVLIAARRLWRTAWGSVAGGCVLAALSFAVGGLHWPSQFLTVALDSRINPHPWLMPNLRGMLYGVPGAGVWEAVLSVLTAVLVWYIARGDVGIHAALAAALAGSLLTSHHAYLPDASLMLPAALTLGFAAQTRWLRMLAILTMLPILYFTQAVPALTAVPPAAVLLLLMGLAYEVRRRRESSEDRGRCAA
jgi:Glycosyltransferase family 87